MTILDTNIFVYLANGTLKRQIVQDIDISFASVSKIEALGYWRIAAAEQDYLRQLFDESEQCNLDESVIELAIKLRLRKNISLPDAIVAATAIEHDCELWTANTADFKHIEGLKLHNPLKNSSSTQDD